MTRIEAKLIPGLLLALALLAGGCTEGDVEPFPEPGSKQESVDILRTQPVGPIIVSYASAPLRRGAPPDGVRAAVVRAIDDVPLSAAAFYWTERAAAMRWIREQMQERRRRGVRPSLILAGHGLGATEASETARELLFQERDFEIALLLTVDAVKAGRIGSAAYVTGNAIVNRLPGVNHSFTAYDAAPPVDGERVLAHVNYYQESSVNYHGTAMSGAENHQIADWTGLLNHGDVDDFSAAFLVSDLRLAIRRSTGRRPE